ncbi:MAG: hypothetical protein RR860_01605, partial [Janthinobacterium sp.]
LCVAGIPAQAALCSFYNKSARCPVCSGRRALLFAIIFFARIFLRSSSCQTGGRLLRCTWRALPALCDIGAVVATGCGSRSQARISIITECDNYVNFHVFSLCFEMFLSMQ